MDCFFGAAVGFLAITWAYGGLFPIRELRWKADSETETVVLVSFDFEFV